MARATLAMISLSREPARQGDRACGFRRSGADEDIAVAKFHTVTIAGNRNNAKIEVGRIGTIDRKLALTGKPPSFERGQIHERIADRPLDLVNILAGKRAPSQGELGWRPYESALCP